MNSDVWRKACWIPKHIFLHPKVFSHRETFAVYKCDTKRFQQLFSSESDNLNSATRMCQKMFVLFTIALCCLQSSFVCRAAEADWEVLNFAISNPGQSNPEVLKNSILNILGSFVPQSPPTAAPVPTTTTARTVPPVTPTGSFEISVFEFSFENANLFQPHQPGLQSTRIHSTGRNISRSHKYSQSSQFSQSSQLSKFNRFHSHTIRSRTAAPSKELSPTSWSTCRAQRPHRNQSNRLSYEYLAQPQRKSPASANAVRAIHAQRKLPNLRKSSKKPARNRARKSLLSRKPSIAPTIQSWDRLLRQGATSNGWTSASTRNDHRTSSKALNSKTQSALSVEDEKFSWNKIENYAKMIWLHFHSLNSISWEKADEIQLESSKLSSFDLLFIHL